MNPYDATRTPQLFHQIADFANKLLQPDKQIQLLPEWEKWAHKQMA